MPGNNAGPLGPRVRSLQIHPTRLCNLQCLHCYSDSGPDRKEQLDAELLERVIDDAVDEGYNVLAVSGGEPLLYPELRALLGAARDAGMVTSLTTNGMLLKGRRLDQLNGALDLLAISLDGLPETHNRMRNSSRAFETMAANLEALRETGIPFGFLFTLTQHNVDQLDWVAGFALSQGAALLQVHPLEEVGRAKWALAGASPDPTEMTYAFLEVLRLQASVGDRMHVHLDLVDRELLRTEPERVYAGGGSDGFDLRLADLVAPLVVETDGTVSPLQHGFPRPYMLGNLHDAPLPALGERWRRATYAGFRELCRRAYVELDQPAELPFANWYETVSRQGYVNHPEPLATSA